MLVILTSTSNNNHDNINNKNKVLVHFNLCKEYNIKYEKHLVWHRDLGGTKRPRFCETSLCRPDYVMQNFRPDKSEGEGLHCDHRHKSVLGVSKIEEK